MSDDTDHQENGPPNEVGPRPGHHSRTEDTDTNNTCSQRTADKTKSRAVGRELRGRRAAYGRMVPLDCGCRDPWPCRCTEPPLSEQALDGWRAAARHVLASGQTPLVPLEVRRALWRRPADRELAELLHQGCGGAVA
jgi:hypothetical protein